jgi:hypothetical protein
LNLALSGLGAVDLLACNAISRSFSAAEIDGADAKAPNATLPTPNSDVISTAPPATFQVAA